MPSRIALVLVTGLLVVGSTRAAPVQTYRIAMVALAEDPEDRAAFEDGLAAKLRAFDYDAVSSHQVIPVIGDLDDRGAVDRLSQAGIRAVLMMKPASVGPGSTLESVRDDVSSEVYADMRAFAREISPSHGDELVAVIHTAIYVFRGGTPELISSGAVWLDEPVETREEGIGKLQDLVVATLNRARPAIREYLGLPPLTGQGDRPLAADR
jgi:hypothetical protein